VAVARTVRVVTPDLQEPLSPELVLACPELREFALERASPVPPVPVGPGPHPAPPVHTWFKSMPRPPSHAPAPHPLSSWRRGRVALPPPGPLPQRPARTRGTAVRTLSRSAAPIVALAVVALAVLSNGSFRLHIGPPKHGASSPTTTSAMETGPTASGTAHPARHEQQPSRLAVTHETRRPRVHRAQPPHGARSTNASRSAAPVASRAAPTHSEVEAERNVLASPGFFLRRLGATQLVDQATRLFRPGTAVMCSTGSPDRHRAHIFDCAVRRGHVTVRARYIAAGTTSFRLLAG
jgi:hypothetical protein